MKRKIDRLVLVLVSALLMATGLLDASRVSAAPPTGPSAETQMTKAAKRGVGGGKANKPSKLPSKARFFMGGGEAARMRLCDTIPIASPDSSLFFVFPEDGEIKLQKPHVDADVIVQPCPARESSSYTYRLIAPDGTRLDEGIFGLDEYSYNFPSDAKEGEYRLYIIESDESSSTTYQRSLFVSHYKGPRVELDVLDDEEDGEDLVIIVDDDSTTLAEEPRISMLSLSPNDVLVAHFYGFEPKADLELALYRHLEASQVADMVGDGIELTVLVDSWSGTADEAGEYEDISTFAPGMQPGLYRFVACALDDCELEFTDAEPFGPPNAVKPPPMAWESFVIVGEDQSIDTGVAPGEACRVEYTVKSGDILSGIARQFGVTVAQLVEANHIETPDLIHVGQKLCIPQNEKG